MKTSAQKLAYKKAYYAANRTRILAERKASQWVNREEFLAKRRAYRKVNKKKATEQRRSWRLANQDREQVNDFRRRLKKYGMTAAEFQRLWDAQGHRCACCGRRCKPYIDHCHKTKRVRAILCNTCNRVLGLIKEQESWARAFIRYIKNHCRPQKPAQLPLLAARAKK